MKDRYVMGIDCGTQSTKAVIFDLSGNIISQGSAVYEPIISPEPGFVEQESKDIWRAFCKAIQECLAKFPHPANEIAAICPTGQGGTVVFMDKDGNDSRNLISWTDSRFYDVTFTGTFYRDHPEVMEKTYKISSVLGFLVKKLTGTFLDNCSYPPPGPPVVQSLLAWPDDPKAYENFYVPREKLMDLVPCGAVFGLITKNAAGDTGLPEKTPVISTARDAQSSMIGTGVIKPGDYFVTYGTSSMVDTQVETSPVSKDGSFTGMGSGIPGYHIAEGWLLRSYWIVTWFKEQFGRDAIEEAQKRGVSAEQLLDKEASSVQPGCDGILIYPFWDARVWCPQARGLIIGFQGGKHERSHVYRAVLEGIAYALRERMEAMSNELAVPISKVVIGGGGSKSKIVMQISADILGKPCQKIHTSETCALGAAITAAVGSGCYSSFDEAINKMVRYTDTYDPIPANRDLYTEYYQKVYKEIYPSLEKVFININGITKTNTGIPTN